MDHYRRGDLVFDVIDEGPADAPVVVLLHGVSHWMLDERPDAVADLILEWLVSHPLPS
jgi:pimeloyl-ACP methyl ester carboxylesterase